MSHSRNAILTAIRSKHVEPTELPSLSQEWLEFADPVEQFKQVLKGVGGQCIEVGSHSEIDAHLETLPQFVAAKVRCSLIPNVGRATLDAESVATPHELEKVEFAVLPGEFAVAENGAVWVNDDKLTFRVLYFICQHLALVVSQRSLVHNMHLAYSRIDPSKRSFGAFISGPSKTADIEQSLVIGAHGPRSHVVFLVKD